MLRYQIADVKFHFVPDLQLVIYAFISTYKVPVEITDMKFIGDVRRGVPQSYPSDLCLAYSPSVLSWRSFPRLSRLSPAIDEDSR